MPSVVTSRRASIDSSVNLDNIKIPSQAVNSTMSFNSVSFKPMSSVASPFTPMVNAPAFVPTTLVASVPEKNEKDEKKESTLTAGLSGLTALDDEFTPSTPYVHKFRTEMCKNWELYGKCKYGDEVSIFLHFSKQSGVYFKIYILLISCNSNLAGMEVHKTSFPF